MGAVGGDGQQRSAALSSFAILPDACARCPRQGQGAKCHEHDYRFPLPPPPVLGWVPQDGEDGENGPFGRIRYTVQYVRIPSASKSQSQRAGQLVAGAGQAACLEPLESLESLDVVDFQSVPYFLLSMKIHETPQRRAGLTPEAPLRCEGEAIRESRRHGASPLADVAKLSCLSFLAHKPRVPMMSSD